MGTFSVWHWAIVLVVIMLLFGGRGKISSLLGDAGKGIRAFKKGLSEVEDEAAVSDPPKVSNDAQRDAEKAS